MCRVFGFAGWWSKHLPPLIRGLIMAEEAGNPHGTGLAVKQVGQPVRMRKKGIRGAAFILRGYSDFLNDIKNKSLTALIGHVRLKTAGEQSDANSHPFGFNVNGWWHHGLHNGIVGCADKLCKEFEITKFAVDSRNVFAAIAKLQNRDKLSTVDAIETVTEFISPDADFAFLYMTPSEVYMWRNEERPLVIVDGRESYLKGRFFCSTIKMLQKAGAMSATDLPKLTYFEAKPYRLYRLDLNDKSLEVEPVRDLKHRRKRSYSYSHFSPIYSDYYQVPFAYGASRSSLPDTPTTKEDSPDTPAIEEFVETLTDDELLDQIFETEGDMRTLEGEEEELEEAKAYLAALFREYEKREEKKKKKRKKKTGGLSGGL